MTVLLPQDIRHCMMSELLVAAGGWLWCRNLPRLNKGWLLSLCLGIFFIRKWLVQIVFQLRTQFLRKIEIM